MTSKDGFLLPYPRRSCLVREDWELKSFSQPDIILDHDFKRCDYDSFSKYSSIKLLAFKDHFKLSVAMRMYRKQLLPIFTCQNI